MSRFGDKLRARLGKKSVKQLEEHRAKKMEARKEKKGGKIISKIESGKISKEKGNRKLKTLQRKTANRSARIRKEDYLKGEGKRTKVTKNPITGRTRTVEKFRDKDGKKRKRVSVTQKKGAMNRYEIERKSKVKSGDVDKVKKKKKIDRYGISTKTITTKARSKKGGIGGRKKKWDRKRYREDPTLTRKMKTIQQGRRKGQKVRDIGKTGGWVDKPGFKTGKGTSKSGGSVSRLDR